MADRAPKLRALDHRDGYLPLEDHGLVGDGATAALVARDGSVVWLCVPRFDAPPLFAAVLDARRGGAFRVRPVDLVAARQRYEPDTAVLVTEMRSPTGLVRVTDALTLRAGADLTEDVPAARQELLRSVRVLDGEVDLLVEVDPRGDAGGERRGDGLRLQVADRDDLDLQLSSTRPLDGLVSRHRLAAGEGLDLTLRWGAGSHPQRAPAPSELLTRTLEAWRRWARQLDYDGPQGPLVRRSAVTLKLLDHFEGGAIVAAPTSSIPEAIGGTRNWDYRFAWIRDAAFAVHALRRIGLDHEARGFLAWVLDAVEGVGRPAVLYDLDGRLPPEERLDPELEGYRGSAPVRWGNAAAEQVQHDALGEILDCAYQWAGGGGKIGEELWDRLRPVVDRAATAWLTPDHGIWEVRTPGRRFTYSAAMCQVALDRGARLAAQRGLDDDARRWSAEAERIRAVVLDEAWDDEAGSLVEHLGGGGLDASLLSLPLRRVVAADHPRMRATVEAVTRHLDAGAGLLHRYDPARSPDGVEGGEGAFLLCSFWLVDNLASQGRLDEAVELYDSLCARASPLGLLPEQVDPTTGAFLGNFPQAFSHVGVVASGVHLHRAVGGRTAEWR